MVSSNIRLKPRAPNAQLSCFAVNVRHDSPRARRVLCSWVHGLTEPRETLHWEARGKLQGWGPRCAHPPSRPRIPAGEQTFALDHLCADREGILCRGALSRVGCGLAAEGDAVFIRPGPGGLWREKGDQTQDHRRGLGGLTVGSSELPLGTSDSACPQHHLALSYSNWTSPSGVTY